jgi:hypothetical protein
MLSCSCMLCLQLPVPTMNRLMRRWGLCLLEPPPQAQQDLLLGVVYRALLSVAERGSTQDVVERLTDMAG